MNHQVFALVGNSEAQQTDEGSQALSAVLSELEAQSQLTLVPDRAQGWLPVPGCARLGEEHAKSLLLRGVCQCQGPDAPSQTFHPQWHLLFSQAGPAATRQEAHF